MLAEAVSAYIAADTTMQALLGTATSRTDKTNGVFPSSAPDQPSMPYVVYYGVGSTPDTSLQGQNRFQTDRIRFSCYGSTAKQAKLLAYTLSRALNRILPGTAATVGFVEWKAVRYITEVDGAEPAGHNTIYGTHVDFAFDFVDTNPNV